MFSSVMRLLSAAEDWMMGAVRAIGLARMEKSRVAGVSKNRMTCILLGLMVRNMSCWSDALSQRDGRWTYVAET